MKNGENNQNCNFEYSSSLFGRRTTISGWN